MHNRVLGGHVTATWHVEPGRKPGDSPGCNGGAKKMVGLLAPRLPPSKQRPAHEVLVNKDMFGSVGRS